MKGGNLALRSYRRPGISRASVRRLLHAAAEGGAQLIVYLHSSGGQQAFSQERAKRPRGHLCSADYFREAIVFARQNKTFRDFERCRENTKELSLAKQVAAVNIFPDARGDLWDTRRNRLIRLFYGRHCCPANYFRERVCSAEQDVS